MLVFPCASRAVEKNYHPISSYACFHLRVSRSREKLPPHLNRCLFFPARLAQWRKTTTPSQAMLVFTCASRAVEKNYHPISSYACFPLRVSRSGEKLPPHLKLCLFSPARLAQ